MRHVYDAVISVRTEEEGSIDWKAVRSQLIENHQLRLTIAQLKGRYRDMLHAGEQDDAPDLVATFILDEAEREESEMTACSETCARIARRQGWLTDEQQQKHCGWCELKHLSKHDCVSKNCPGRWHWPLKPLEDASEEAHTLYERYMLPEVLRKFKSRWLAITVEHIGVHDVLPPVEGITELLEQVGALKSMSEKKRKKKRVIIFVTVINNHVFSPTHTAKCPRSYYLLGKIRWLLKEWQNQVNRDLEEDARREEELVV